MDVVSTIESGASAAVAAVSRDFHSIAARLTAAAGFIGHALGNPNLPPGLRTALPMLVDALEDLRQEVAELRKPSACEGCAGAPAASEVVQSAAPGVEASTQVEKDPKVVPLFPTENGATSILPLPTGTAAVTIKSITIDGQELDEEARARFIAWLEHETQPTGDQG